jgi:DNA polymerase-3 subunit gamma/tau
MYMGQALYRKYRPRSLKEVAGQEYITRTLQQALEKRQISHAYLFTGPKGVGKTSIARILAHEINDLKYDDDSTHIDIIEIDAASNRRIDEIRELRERVYVAPSEAKYKVYIIDEVHMLTKEAFNALLKTLEEPPAHVVFILATTDSHKLPETIISRTQRFSFKPIQTHEIAAQLKQIAKDEKIKISDDALDLIGEHGQGSLRDSISLLDQARSQDKEIDVNAITQILGLPPKSALKNLLESTLEGSSTSDLITQLNVLFDQGYQAGTISKQLGRSLRNKLINGNSTNEQLILNLLADLIDVPVSHDPERYLEIVLLKAKSKSVESTISMSNVPIKAKLEIKNSPHLTSEFSNAVKDDIKTETKLINNSPVITNIDDELWAKILNALKQKYNTLYGVIRMASPNFDNKGKLDLVFAFEFHKKRISETNNKKALAGVIKELTGKDVEIECHYNKNATPYHPKKIDPKPKTIPSDISTISNIFNGAELLES